MQQAIETPRQYAAGDMHDRLSHGLSLPRLFATILGKIDFFRRGFR
jgi:hypothetical protein